MIDLLLLAFTLLTPIAVLVFLRGFIFVIARKAPYGFWKQLAQLGKPGLLAAFVVSLLLSFGFATLFFMGFAGGVVLFQWQYYSEFVVYACWTAHLLLMVSALLIVRATRRTP